MSKEPPISVEDAAKEYADKHADQKWNKASELEAAFLAGHQYSLSCEKGEDQDKLWEELLNEYWTAPEPEFLKSKYIIFRNNDSSTNR